MADNEFFTAHVRLQHLSRLVDAGQQHASTRTQRGMALARTGQCLIGKPDCQIRLRTNQPLDAGLHALLRRKRHAARSDQRVMDLGQPRQASGAL